ncbi:MAG: tRNA (adenosine(37)-N6)-threonylcarbamoyltransferase complex transferase subunit TsaD [Candidatus Omnitrophota bacterium]
MITLGIETSCDETSVSVTDGRKILSNVVTSSVHLHSEFGGVVPEIASRFHLEYITPVMKESLKEAGLSLDKVELIAVTKEPGLIGSLLVGISMAKALGYSLSVPVVEVNHIIAHIYANLMHYSGIDFPLMGLIVSGGHTLIIWMDDIDKWKVIGETQDDAVGEAYDKVAKMLGLGYPGGPVIEKRAALGDPRAVRFPRSHLRYGVFDYSFSGIKTAVLYYLQKHGSTKPTDEMINDICAGFQDAVCDMLIEKVVLAAAKKRADALVVGGGVSANMALRDRLERESKRRGIKTYFPPIKLCLDNAAMVGGLGEALYKKRQN